MPKLSIIIPALNEEKGLPLLFESLKKQSFKDYEVIVADSNSKDRTREIAREFGATVTDGGLPGVGRNKGAKVAKGKIFLFLDADVVFPRVNFLEKTISEFEKRKLDIASCLLKPLSKKIIDHVFHSIYNVYTYTTQKLVPHIPGFFIYVRREIHEKINGFDEDLKLAEDHDYARRATKFGKFGFLHSAFMPVSVRRFDRDGRLSIAAKYLIGEMYLIAHGKIPNGAIEYGFGYDKSQKQDFKSVAMDSYESLKKFQKSLDRKLFLKRMKEIGEQLWRSDKYRSK